MVMWDSYLQSSLISWTAQCAVLDPRDGAPKTLGTPVGGNVAFHLYIIVLPPSLPPSLTFVATRGPLLVSLPTAGLNWTKS